MGLGAPCQERFGAMGFIAFRGMTEDLRAEGVKSSVRQPGSEAERWFSTGVRYVRGS